ncbi:MAG: hypothetical protein IJ318_02920 [Clostridia bacterium]|nr:hypothetical protein [Clostridia bacterium]
MKKIFCFCFVIFFVACSSCCNLVFHGMAFASMSYYAHITDTAIYLYSTPSQTDSSKMFELPKTYFVELLSSANDEFYSARYQDVYGYVLKNQVKPINGAPLVPFLNDINFRIFVPSGAHLRSSPYNNGSVNLVYSIPFLDNNISYYGTAQGEEAISKKGTTWYFCKYYTDNTEYTGYVYAPLCDCLSTINQNTETVEYLSNEQITFDDTITNTSTQPFAGLSQTATTVIIVAISLPCLLLIYLLFKPTRMAEQSASTETTQEKKYKKKKITRLKNSDYFELDDDF